MSLENKILAKLPDQTKEVFLALKATLQEFDFDDLKDIVNGDGAVSKENYQLIKQVSNGVIAAPFNQVAVALSSVVNSNNDFRNKFLNNSDIRKECLTRILMDFTDDQPNTIENLIRAKDTLDNLLDEEVFIREGIRAGVINANTTNGNNYNLMH